MTKIIIDAIKAGLSLPEIAKLYAQAFIEKRPVNWKEINYAIINKWNFETLNKIKKLAWDIIGRENEPMEVMIKQLEKIVNK